jgi:alcohol dehydrogenase class IV
MAKELMGQYRYLPIEKVSFGAGVIKEISSDIELLGFKRVAVISSNSLMNSSFLKQIKVLLGDRLAAVVSGTIQHAPASSIFEIADKLRKHDVDLLISFGGGTVIDSTKAVALVLGEGLSSVEQLKNYAVKFEYPDKITIPSIDKALVPHISIPTTLSAAEFSNIIGITNETKKVKELFIDDKLTPIRVYLDPIVTLDTPEWLWSATGMRALDHAIETIYSKQTQIIPTTLALEAIKILNENLRLCKKNPTDLQARLKCQLAAWMSFFGVTNVMMGLSHGIGHQIGAHANVAHGITSSIMLPHVMRYCLPVTIDAEAIITSAMDIDTSGMSKDEAARMAADAVNKLVEDLELPARLRDVEVSKSLFSNIAKDAMEDLVVASSPRTVKGVDDVVQLLEQAW